MRCQVMELPVVYSGISKDIKKSVLYFPFMTDITKEMREVYTKSLLSNNTHVVQKIQKQLQLGYYKLPNGKRVRFAPHSKVVQCLHRCIATIISKTRMLDQYDTYMKTLTLEDYRKCLAPFYAVNLFTHGVLNTVARTLFVNPSPTRILFDPTLLETLVALQSGGGEPMEDSEIRIEFEFLEINTVDRFEEGDHEWDYPEHILFSNKLYNILLEVEAETSETERGMTTIFINDIMYQYFKLVGESNRNETFLHTLIKKYQDGTLHQLTHADFEHLYSQFSTVTPTNFDALFGPFLVAPPEQIPTLFSPPIRKEIPVFGGKTRRKRKVS